ncbi:hypothetical protein JCM10550A_03990 [Methanogenium cariaci]|jgi:hypothetical protein
MVFTDHLPITENPDILISLPVNGKYSPVRADIHTGVRKRYIALWLMRRENKEDDFGLKQ